jgi:hypothetical protein
MNLATLISRHAHAAQAIGKFVKAGEYSWAAPGEVA